MPASTSNGDPPTSHSNHINGGPDVIDNKSCLSLLSSVPEQLITGLFYNPTLLLLSSFVRFDPCGGTRYP